MARKKKGKAPEGKYAQIPVGLAKEVMGELSAPELRVWLALCFQCQHWSNGTGKLCRSVIREFHLGSQRVVTVAKKKLIETRRIVETRKAKQRVCALYAVTHLPLNLDAMANDRMSDSEVYAALDRFRRTLRDTNRGSASSDTKEEPLTVKIDNRGSAKPLNTPLALPKSQGYVSESTSLALPHGNTSKNLPSPNGISSADSGSRSAYLSLSKSLQKNGGPISTLGLQRSSNRKQANR